MNKICILSCVNIKHMTLISLYTDILRKKNISYDIIYMDKYGEEEEFDAVNKYRFVNKIQPKSNKIVKVMKYMKFVNYSKRKIKENNYDFIIVWNEITAMMFVNYLSKKWKKRYSLNYRDYLFQDYPILSLLNKKVIENSAFTTISSEGFRSFLPESEYIHVHSFNENILSSLVPRKSLQKNKIKLTFIGNIRFFDKNIQLLQIFKNDERFELHFYGTNAEVLEQYCKENQIFNAVFSSAFPVNLTSEYIKKTDIVNNLYGNNQSSLDFALSIKLYYGIYYRTPILVNPDTYMAKKISEYKIGFIVEEIDSELPNKIYEWYRSINFNEFDNSCLRFINDIKETNQIFIDKFNQYLIK